MYVFFLLQNFIFDFDRKLRKSLQTKCLFCLLYRRLQHNSNLMTPNRKAFGKNLLEQIKTILTSNVS